MDNEDQGSTDAASTLLVLARDATVVATAGHPRSWIGTRLTDRDDVPADVKRAARGLLDLAAVSPPPMCETVRLESTRQILHLAVVEALPIRRTRRPICAFSSRPRSMPFGARRSSAMST